MKKGIFEIDETRGFKFGTYAMGIACQEDNCSVDVIYKRIGMAYIDIGENGEKVVKKDPPNIMSLLRVFYGAAVHYAESKKIKHDFSPADVSDWLDELGLDKVNQILKDGLNQYEPKNSNTLAETRESVTQ